MITHDIRKFEWDKEHKILSTECSLLDQGGKVKAFDRMFDDTCDVGFNIKGKREIQKFIVDDENEHTIILKPILRSSVNKVLVFKT